MGAQFKILNADGKAIPINDLDREACELWGKEYDDDEYANPFTPEPFTNPNNLEGIELTRAKIRHRIEAPTLNWFDMIGSKIAFCRYSSTSWEDIKQEIMSGVSHKFFSEDRQLTPIVGEGNNTRLPDDLSFKLVCYVEFVRPFIDLIDSWKDKGYQPITIK